MDARIGTHSDEAEKAGDLVSPIPWLKRVLGDCMGALSDLKITHELPAIAPSVSQLEIADAKELTLDGMRSEMRAVVAAAPAEKNFDRAH